jgi:hypothetical protein
MGVTNKVFSLLIVVILAVSSLMMIESAFAQSIPKPSVPEFTVEFIPNYSNTATTDPYTGTNTTTTQNLSTIKLTITNQQYSYTNGSTFGIYYNIRVKGHFDPNSWNEIYPTTQLLPSTVNITILNANNYQTYEEPYIWGQNRVYSYQYLPQSTSTNTIVSLSASNYPSNSQLDIQAEAMLGVNSTFYQPSNDYAYGAGGSYYPAIAYVTSSDWSNTQTINLANGSISASTSPNPTPTSTPNYGPTSSPTPSIPEFSWLMILPLFLSTFFVVVLSRKRKLSNS